MELDQVTLNGEPYVQINVSDTGPGIPPQMLEKVFERYFQADNGNNGAYNYGTGIGLFYSRSLAQIHHGTLTAANRPEGGASFTLLLPASEEAYPESERIKEAVPGMAELPLDTVITQEESVSGDDDDRSVILAVDDDSDVLDYLAALFSGSYTVLRANGADEALKTALDKSPDIVLSDVSMPGRSGFDLCRDLKSSLQLSHVPVILVTAKGTVQNQVQGLDLGADAYVTKPFDPDYLKALVKSQLENRRRIRNILNSATRTSEVDTLSPRDRFFLDKLYDLMESEISNEDLDITRLTELLKISRTKFYYKIKGLTGKTPSEFFMQYKLNIAAKMLKEGKLNVSEIAARTGFNTLPHFSKAFKKQFGVSPSKYEG